MPLAPHVEVIVEDEGWGDPSPTVERAIAVALDHLGLDPQGYEVSVLACGDARSAELNGRFRGQDKATNVLSWPAVDLRPETPGARPEPPEPGSREAPEALGDIALALGVCTREAEAAGRPLAAHVAHLTVHGLLHLLGYDHETEADAALMESAEAAILARLGLPDPYAVPGPAPAAGAAAEAER